MLLENYVVLITGGCGDIGRATAGRLANAGASVILLDLLEQELGEQVARSVAGPANHVSYRRCSVTNRPEVDSTFSEITGKHSRIDVVIANAAGVESRPFLDLGSDSWARTLDANLTGSFHVAQAAARVMVQQKLDKYGVRGKILFTSSWVQDMPWPEITAYVVSKAGMKALARNIAQELAGQGVLANIVAPGIVMAGLSRKLYESDPGYRPRATQAIPLGEFGTPEQIADAFAFLCGPECNYMTGSVLLIDGGASLVKRS